MSFLTANLEVLQRRFPTLYEDLCRLPPPEVEEPRLAPSRSEEPTLYYGGRLAYSAYQPRRDAERALPQLDPTWDAFVLVGWGLGYAAQVIVQRASDLPLIIVEPDQRVFLLSLQALDLTKVFQHSFLVLAVGQEACQTELWQQFSFRDVGLHQLRCVSEVFPAWIAQWDDCRRTSQAQARVNEDTLKRFFPLWLRNHARNRKTSGWHPLMELKGRAKGKAVVIAAAGPSLTESLSFLKKYRSRYVLIAVDTAYSLLVRQGLAPDFLTVGDGQYWNARHLDDGVLPSTQIVTDFSVSPRVFRWAQQIYVSGCQVPFLRGWEQKAGFASEVLPSGGSVATMAWSLAKYLEAAEVWFAGLDLGYTKGTHAQGSQFEEGFLRQGYRLKPAETLGFRLLSEASLTWREGVTAPVRSDLRMDLYRAWLEKDVARSPELPVWNLSSSGSLIKGLKRPVGEIPVPFGADARSNSAVNDSGYSSKISPKDNQPVHDQGVNLRWNIPRVSSALNRLLATWPQTSLHDEKQEIREEFLSSWKATEALMRESWGDLTWTFLTHTAVRTWETFPGPRSLARLKEVVVVLLSIAELAETLSLYEQN